MSGSRKSSRRKFTVDSLFQDTSPRAIGVRDLVEAKEIDIDRIIPDPDQPRQTFEQDALDELAASIRSDGILQPIAVRYESETDQYVILHGERRWRASRLAGLTRIPAIVRDVPQDRRLLQQLMENVVREDLNAVDRAAGLRALKRQMNDAPWEQVAEAVGIRRSRLFQLLSTEKLPERLQDRIRSGQISEKQTRPLQGLSAEAQEILADQIVSGEVEARTIEAVARRLRNDMSYLELERDDLWVQIRALIEENTGRGQKVRPPNRDDQLKAALETLFDLSEQPDRPEDVLASLRQQRRSEQLPKDHIQAVALDLANTIVAPDGQANLQARRRDLRALKKLIDLALNRSDIE